MRSMDPYKICCLQACHRLAMTSVSKVVLASCHHSAHLKANLARSRTLCGAVCTASMVLQIGKMKSSITLNYFFTLPALRVGVDLSLKQNEGTKEKGQLCLMSLLGLWIAPGFHLCLLVCFQKLCLYSLVVGTSIAKQLGQDLLCCCKSPQYLQSPPSSQPCPYSAHQGLECKRRIPVVPVVWWAQWNHSSINSLGTGFL